MAIYGVNFYGSTTYGYVPPTQFKALNFNGIPDSYDSVLLSWGLPGGAWDHMYLVRSSFEFVSAPGDGTVVLDADASSAPGSFVDTGLQPGRFYYYTFLVRTEDATPRFAQAGVVIVLVTYDYDYRDQLYQLLPSIYREKDNDLTTIGANPPGGPLFRYLELIGYQDDVLKSEIDSLLWTYNVDLVSGGLLPLLANQFNLDFEPEIGMKALRRLLKNIVFLYKNRGNQTGLEGLLSALTGYPIDITIGRNMMLSQDVANFKQGIGTWNVFSGTATLSWNGTSSPVGQDTLPGCMGLLAGATGTVVIQSGANRYEAIPVQAGLPYTASAYGRADAISENMNVRIRWLDKDGAVLSSSSYGTAVATTTSDWSTRCIKTATAPTDAVFALVQIQFTGLVSGETQWIDSVQFEFDSSVSAFQRAREIEIQVLPVRTNLCANPSFETDTTSWTPTNCTVSRVTSDSKYGTASAQMHKNTGTTVSSTLEGPSLFGAALIDENDITSLFFASCYIKPLDHTCTMSVGFTLWTEYFPGGVGLLTPVDGDSRFDHFVCPVNQWTRIYSSSVPHDLLDPVNVLPYIGAPFFLQWGVREVHGTGLLNGDDVLVDAFLLERSESLGDYFDGSSGAPVEDYLWAGTHNESSSYYYPKRTARNSRMLQLIPKNIPINAVFSVNYLPS